ncbi:MULTISPECIES: hypothetical protein [unclassified Microbacterium]|uniref:Tail terminator n=1 Tax=Microbacterium phage Footloose TaxID=2836048 RepID=A0A8F3IM23_9CAUD|nr:MULTISPECIES: hypothetical protein [unclassified Microbacterium]YP_010754407.1 tail terminator [Microbacterium phage Footloose]MDH5134070.1 hypothetical protein [Microbacterium sp. RD10]MDH5136826.1 hypothetical protein [Microbacterium sp. RD11]MDH5146393.1 hypothetical protein [Microbacterium sp. RD12]MDH5155127.1 hypothetical protein [Microbacterium sp. RD06]MDH5166591.1 hypothetical protein [Microbacterium sp. RD02]
MKAEFAAFRARLEEHPILAGKVFPIVRKNGDEAVRANYVVAKSSKPDRLDDARFTAVSVFESDRRFTYDVRVVTTSDGALDTLGEPVLRQLVGHSLVVPGRRCSPIGLVPDVEEGDGYDRTADLFFRDFSFRFWSRRA